MTLSTSTASQTFPGNGVTQIFPCGFRIFQASDISVSLVDAVTGISTPLALNSDYTLTGEGDQTGFTLSTSVPVATGTNLLVARNIPYTQPTDFTNQGSFFPTMHEDCADRLGMQIQQLAGGAQRTLQLPDGIYPVASGTLPYPSPLAPLVWNSSGNGLENGSTSMTGDMLLRGNLASAAAGNGADLVGFLQAGTGAVSRTSKDKMRETRISVKDFGAVGDGVADDTSAFNAAVSYCASRNGGVIFVPAGTYLISSMITVCTNNIVFQGEGFDTQHDAGQPVHPTLLQWRGGTDDAMLLFTSIAGVSNKCLAGCGVLDLALSGYNSVGGTRPLSNVELRSHRGGKFRFYGTGGGSWILKLGVVSQLGEAEDTQYNTFSVWGRQLSTPGGGIYLGGNGNNPPNANTSFNRFELVDLQIDAGTGISFGNSDTNIVEVARIIGVTTGKAYEFLGSNLNTSDTARGNFVRLMSSMGPGYARGTTTYTYPSVSNYIGLDIGNGTPIPTVETGATCYYSAEAGAVKMFPSGARMNLSDNLTSALNDRPNVTNESLRILNSSQNHVRLTDGTNAWGIYLTGGNLRFKLLSGSGTIGFGVFSGSSDAAVNGYVTIQDANGNVRKLATIA